MDKNKRIPAWNLRGPQPPLQIAAAFGLIHVATYLLDICRVDINEVCCDHTALERAVLANNEPIIRLFLGKKHTQVNRFHEKQTGSALHKAISTTPRILKLLLRHPGADINDRDYQGETLFATACFAGRVDMLQLLFNLRSMGLLVDTVDKGRDTPSHRACLMGHVRIVRFLVDCHIFQPFAVNDRSMTPLDLSSYLGEINIIRYTLDYFREVTGCEMYETQGRKTIGSLLKYSARAGHLNIVRLLLNKPSVILDLRHVHYCLYDAIEVNKVKVAVFIIETLKSDQVYEPMRHIVARDMLQRNIWSPYKELVRALMSFWSFNFRRHYIENHRRILRNINFEGRMLRLEHKTVKTLFMKGTQHSKSLLYHTILFGDTKRLTYMLHSRSVSISDLTCAQTNGISLLNMSTKNIGIMQAITDHYGYNIYDDFAESLAYKQWHTLLKLFTSSIKQVKYPSFVSFDCLDVDSIVEDEFSNDDRSKQSVLFVLDLIRISFKLNNDNLEKRLIFKTIRSLMRKLSLEVGKINRLFKFEAVQVGSSMEGTRAFMPDEFDFLLVCRAFHRFLKMTYDGNVAIMAVIRIKAGIEHFPRYLIQRGDYLDIGAFKKYMDSYIKTAIKVIFERGQFGASLYVDPNSFETKKISCLHLIWRGHRYKDMPISIDLVPSLVLDTYQPVYQYVAEPCNYYAFCKIREVDWHDDKCLCPVAFSDVELKVIKSMPQSARDGLKLAKGMRVTALFPQPILDLLQGVFCIDDYLTTYMLKTSLVFCFKYMHSFVSPFMLAEEWAFLIYCHLELRLIHGKDLPSLFDIPHLHQDYSLFHCRDPADIASADQRACCIMRKNLTVISTFMRKVLQLDLEKREKSTEPLYEIAMRACHSEPAHWFQ